MMHTYSSKFTKNAKNKRDNLRLEQKISEKIILGYASSFTIVKQSKLPDFYLFLN